MTNGNGDKTSLVPNDDIAEFNIQLSIRNLSDPLVRKFRIKYDEVSDEIQKKVKQKEEEETKLTRKIREELLKIAKNHFTDKVKQLRDAGKALGVDVVDNYHINSPLIGVESPEEEDTFRAKLEITSKDRKSTDSQDCSQLSGVFICSMKCTDKVIELRREHDNCRHAVRTYRKELENRKKNRKQQLDDVREHAEEHITMAQLRRSESGDKLAEGLEEVGDQLIDGASGALAVIEATAEPKRITNRKTRKKRKTS